MNNSEVGDKGLFTYYVSQKQEFVDPPSLGVPKKTQLLNFQVAPKNCGDATLEKPKNVWV